MRFDMRKTTIIVGAGATIAEALSTRPNKSLTPPLDITFFELCRISKYPGNKVIREYMLNQFGINPFIGGYGMEEIFNFIFSDVFSGNPSQRCLEAYWALIGLYRSSLMHTTNPIASKGRYGVGQLIRSLYNKYPNREINIVTFNQDLVIEKALEHTISLNKYANIPWSIDIAYGVTFPNTLKFAQGPKPFAIGGNSSVNIHKMHGSLNWVYSVRSGTDPKNSLRQPMSDLICINDQDIRHRITYKRTTRANDLIPLIVPPVYEKSSIYKDVLQPVWTKAMDDLTNTEELIVFGYSFPDADFAAKSMIRQALHNNHNVRCLYVIDKSPFVAAKIADIINIPTMHYHTNVKHFSDNY